MRVASAVSLSAENEDERGGRLERMRNSASASRAAENEEESVHPELEYRFGLPICRLLWSAFRLPKSSWSSSDWQMDKTCGHCSDKKQKGEPQGMCCNNGDVWLPLLDPPSGGFLSYNIWQRQQQSRDIYYKIFEELTPVFKWHPSEQIQLFKNQVSCTHSKCRVKFTIEYGHFSLAQMNHKIFCKFILWGRNNFK